MSQKRYIDFGALVTADGITSITSSLFGPGVLSGADFFVNDVSQLRISTHAIIMPNGLIVIEDEQKLLDIPASVSAINYTIAYKEDGGVTLIGGQTVILQLLTGIYYQDSFDGCILGYVKYPGGAVPLSVEHFVPVKKHKVISTTSPVQEVNFAPFPSKWYLNGDSDFLISYGYDSSSYKNYLEIYNNDVITHTMDFLVPFIIREKQPYKFTITAYADLDALITINLILPSGTTLTLSNNLITNTLQFVTRDIIIPNLPGVFEMGKTFYCKVSIQNLTGKKVKIHSIGVSGN